MSENMDNMPEPCGGKKLKNENGKHQKVHIT